MQPPQPTTITELQNWVEHRFRAISEISPRADGKEFVPNEGWHTIRVGTGQEIDLHVLRTWAHLFNNYATYHVGAGLFWRDVVHFDRDKHELVGTFCIQ